MGLVVSVFLSRAFASELSDYMAGRGYPSSIRQVALEMVLAVGSSGALYWAVGIPLCVLLFLAALSPLGNYLNETSPAPAGRVRAVFGTTAVYCILIVLVMLALRWPALSLMQCNPDESEEIAGAMTLCQDPVFWRSVDGATHGPLVFYVLILPRIFGLPIGYGSAKLVGLLLMIGSVLLLYATLKRLVPEALARIAVLPVATCVALFTFWDYVAYNAEHITIFVLALALYLFSLLATAPLPKLHRWAFVFGVIAGSVPFTKLQGLPAALILVAMSVVVVCVRAKGSRSDVMKSVVTLAAGCLVVPLAVLGLVLSFGITNDFWQSYIVNNFSYTGRHHLTFADKLSQMVTLISHSGQMRAYFYSCGALCVLYLAAAAVFARKVPRRKWWLILAAVLLCTASFLSVLLPGNRYPHYLLLLLFPLAFLCALVVGAVCAAAGTVVEPALRKALKAAAVGVFLLAGVLGPFVVRISEGNDIFARAQVTDRIAATKVARTILAYARPGERMASWGWMARYHVQTGLIQGTRDGATVRQIDQGPQQAYYMQRYMRDLERNRPPVFLDTVGPGEFWFKDRSKYGHEVFPELAAYVSEHYRLVADVENRRIYVSKKRLDKPLQGR